MQNANLKREPARRTIVTNSEPTALHGTTAEEVCIQPKSEHAEKVPTFYSRGAKRIFDIVAAMFGLAATSPLLLFCAIAVRIGSSGPIFFLQRRVGQRGKPFNIIKFRTMVHRAEQRGLRITAEGDPRVTAAGKWLRKLKLDELPQLLNVLKGDMSFVGPRGEVPEYVAGYDAEQLKVLEVKPGITGPASLAYIDEASILARQSDKEGFYVHTLLPRKLMLDLAYCRRITFRDDLKLILATLKELFESDGVNSKPHPLSSQTGNFHK